MKLKLLILMILALTVTACNNDLEARVTALENVFIDICNTETERRLLHLRGENAWSTLPATWEVRLQHYHVVAYFDEGFCEDMTGLDTTE